MSLHTSNRLAGLAQVAEVKLAVRRRCGQKEPGMRRLRGNPHAAGIDNARANDARWMRAVQRERCRAWIS